MNKPLRCCSCNKVIAENVSIQAGVVKITCKCGTVNEIKAEPKQSVPYGERVGYVAKAPFGFTCKGDVIDAAGVVLKKDEPWGGTPLNTSKNAIRK